MICVSFLPIIAAGENRMLKSAARLDGIVAYIRWNAVPFCSLGGPSASFKAGNEFGKAPTYPGTRTFMVSSSTDFFRCTSSASMIGV